MSCCCVHALPHRRMTSSRPVLSLLNAMSRPFDFLNACKYEPGRLIRRIKRPGKLKCMLIRLNLKLPGPCYRELSSNQLAAINAKSRISTIQSALSSPARGT